MKTQIILLFMVISIFQCTHGQTPEINTVSLKIDLCKDFPPDSLNLIDQENPQIRMLKIAEKEYRQDPENPDKLIWYGRRMAYTGEYEKAIALYTMGIEKFPADARFLRHRGHRFISTRQYDKAIEDFELAGKLIEGNENEIEPDGMPNAAGIPVSTLHGNIWYHLGLAYYLKHDYAKAYDAYFKCRESGNNSDNIVSSTHWLYMIQQRLGNPEMADSMLEPIQKGMKVIENQNYYDLCLFYKGQIKESDLQRTLDDNPAADAIKYGIANWYFYNGQKQKSRELLEQIIQGQPTSSFGFLAAESDLDYYFK